MVFIKYSARPPAMTEEDVRILNEQNSLRALDALYFFSEHSRRGEGPEENGREEQGQSYESSNAPEPRRASLSTSHDLALLNALELAGMYKDWGHRPGSAVKQIVKEHKEFNRMLFIDDSEGFSSFASLSTSGHGSFADDDEFQQSTSSMDMFTALETDEDLERLETLNDMGVFEESLSISQHSKRGIVTCYLPSASPRLDFTNTKQTPTAPDTTEKTLFQVLQEDILQGLCTRVMDQRVQDDSYFVPISHDRVTSYSFALAKATRTEDVPTLQRFLRDDPDALHSCSAQGESLLHIACRREDEFLVEFFLDDAKVSPRVKDDCWSNPLHEACWTRKPNFELLRRLIYHSPHLLWARDSRGFTPLDNCPPSTSSIWKGFLQTERLFLRQTVAEEQRSAHRRFGEESPIEGEPATEIGPKGMTSSNSCRELAYNLGRLRSILGEDGKAPDQDATGAEITRCPSKTPAQSWQDLAHNLDRLHTIIARTVSNGSLNHMDI